MSDERDEHAHFLQATKGGEPWLGFAGRGLALGDAFLEASGQRWEDTYSNEFAATALLGRAHRSLHAAVMLTLHGYYPEAATVVRGAYEAGSLARMLAQEPEDADRWLRDGEWIPDRDVRAWIREHFDEDTADLFRQHYSNLCRVAHPTSSGTLEMAAVEIDDARWWPRRLSSHHEKAVESILLFIAACTLWLDYAMANSAAGEVASSWRELVDDFQHDFLEALDGVGEPGGGQSSAGAGQSEVLARVGAAADLAERLRGYAQPD